MIPQNQSNNRYMDIKQTYSSQKLSVETMASKRRIKTPHARECRICLQSSDQSPDKQFIDPCQCSGTVKYVHEECLREWIQSCLKKKTFLEAMKAKKDGLQCQMCKQRIRFQTTTQWKCNNCQQICKKICSHKILFFVLLLLFLISATGTGYSIYLLSTRNNTDGENNSIGMEIILGLSGVFLMGVFLIVSSYTFVMDFLLKNEQTIDRIGLPNSNPNRVYPIKNQPDSQIEIVELD